VIVAPAGRSRIHKLAPAAVTLEDGGEDQ
jgi:hypothetical protein